MNICVDCGRTFEDEDILWVKEDHGEVFGWCPYCKDGGFEEARFCKICGEPFREDELTNGYCDDCLEEQLTFDSFLEFALDDYEDDDASYFEDFMFRRVYGFEKSPNESSRLFKEVLIKDYKERAESWFNSGLMDLIRDDVCMLEFAEYLEAKEVRECIKKETV